MSYLTLADGITPATPASAKTRLYTQAGRLLKVGVTNNNVLSLSAPPGNPLRNSGFWFAQRQTPGTATTYNSVSLSGTGQFCADGWAMLNETASAQYSRVDTKGTGSESGLAGRYYGKLGKITSAGKMGLFQKLESKECLNLRGRNIRVSFKLRAPSPSQWNISLPQVVASDVIDGGHPGGWGTSINGPGVDPVFFSNAGLGVVAPYVAPTANKTGENCVAGVNSYVCNVTSQWQRFSGIFTVPIDCLNLYVFLYSQQQVAAAADAVYVAEAMVTDGEGIYDFSHMGMAVEYIKVARFYQKSFAIDTAPVTALGVNTGETHFPSPVGASTAIAGQGFNLPVRQTLDISGILNVLNPAAANNQVRNVTLGTDCTSTSLSLGNGCETELNVFTTTPTSTAVGHHLSYHWTIDREI